VRVVFDPVSPKACISALAKLSCTIPLGEVWECACTRVILNCFRHLTDGTFLLMPCLVRASMGKPCRPDLTVGGARGPFQI